MAAMMAPFTPVLAGVLFIQMGYGLIGSLLPIRLGLMEAGAEAAGIVAAGYFGGLLLGALIGQRVLRRVGHIRAFAAFAAVGSAIVLLLPILPDWVAWTGLRFVAGFGAAGLFLIVESWLNMTSTNASRGQALAFYNIVGYGALACGQLLLVTFDPAGFQLFSIAAMLIALAILPMTLTGRAQPVIPRPTRLRLRDLLAISPVGMIGAVVAGAVIGAIFGLLPFYGERTGLAVNAIAYLMATVVMGGLVFAVPLGRLSDRIDRRIVIALACAGLVGISIAFLAVGGIGTGAGLLLALCFGGAAFPLYSLSVAHMNDHLGVEDAVAAGGGLLLAYGLGAMGGPLVAAAVMRAIGPEALFVYTALGGLGLGVLAVVRVFQRPSVAAADKSGFVAVPETTPVALALDPRSEPAPETDAEVVGAAAVRGDGAA